jgi:hypothetical protein
VILAAPARVDTAAPLPREKATTQPPAQPKPGPAGAPRIDPRAVEAAACEVEPNTTLGAVVFDRVTGTTLLSLNAGRQFRSASLVKLLIAIDVLDHDVAEPERDRIARMLSLSDDDIASALWVEYGPGIVPRVAKRLGLRGTEAPELAGKWGEVKVTPDDMLRVYRYVLARLPDADRTLIVDALGRAPRHAADGFDQYFGIPDGLGPRWAVKQGWGNNDHAMVLHSTGLVGANWRYVVVLLTEHPLGSGWRTSADSVTAAANALTGRLPGA